MKLSANIILHELNRMGLKQSAQFGSNREFVWTSLYHDAPLDPDTLYVASSKELSAMDPSERRPVVFISSEDAPDLPNVIRIKGISDPLDLFNHVQDIFLKFKNWEDNMNNLILSGRDIQSLIDVSEDILVNHMEIIDSSFKLIGYTKNTDCTDDVSIHLINNGYHSVQSVRRFNINKRIQVWNSSDGLVINTEKNVANYTTVIKPFRQNSSLVLIVVMICNKCDPEQWLLDLFLQFLDKIKYFVNKDYPSVKHAGYVFESLIEDLFENNKLSESELLARAGYTGVPFRSEFLMITIPASDNSNIPINYAAADFARSFPQAKIAIYNGKLIMLFWDDNLSFKYIRSLQERLAALLERYSVNCGISSVFDVLTNASEAYLQTQEALRIGRRKGGAKSAHLFDDHLIEYMAERCMGKKVNIAASSYYCSKLKKIKEYDSAHQTNHCEFINVYIKSGYKTSETASIMHIHRNSVLYKLSVVKDLFDLDLLDPEVCQRLYTAEEILKIY